ncbi:hypothetical protein [Palleronia sp. THAF1]|uniref:hypothetical protein n=1 Tax=Palleronia sp. THAF1 TaxID=2587842 RepID=UPI000F546C5B|nr:hypothetical protein [Palleronia sp. THAF1]
MACFDRVKQANRATKKTVRQFSCRDDLQTVPTRRIAGREPDTHSVCPIWTPALFSFVYQRDAFF